LRNLKLQQITTYIYLYLQLFNITSTQKNTAKSVPKTIQEYFLQTVTQHQHKVLLRLVFLKQNSFSNVLWAMQRLCGLVVIPAKLNKCSTGAEEDGKNVLKCKFDP